MANRQYSMGNRKITNNVRRVIREKTKSAKLFKYTDSARRNGKHLLHLDSVQKALRKLTNWQLCQWAKHGKSRDVGVIDSIGTMTR